MHKYRKSILYIHVHYTYSPWFFFFNYTTTCIHTLLGKKNKTSKPARKTLSLRRVMEKSARPKFIFARATGWLADPHTHARTHTSHESRCIFRVQMFASHALFPLTLGNLFSASWHSWQADFCQYFQRARVSPYCVYIYACKVRSISFFFFFVF